MESSPKEKILSQIYICNNMHINYELKKSLVTKKTLDPGIKSSALRNA